MTKPQRRRDDDLQNAIYQVTYHLLLTTTYDQITFARIAREAKTSRSVLYRYWDSLFSLVLDTVHTSSQQEPQLLTDLNFDEGNLRANLLAAGQNFAEWMNSVPTEFNRLMLAEMASQNPQVTKLLSEATEYHTKVMDHILKLALQHREIINYPPIETKLALFKLIRYALVIENRTTSAKTVTDLVDHIVLPAILSFSRP